HRYVHGVHQVETVPLELRMRRDPHVHVEVAVGSTTRAGRAAAGEAQRGAVVHTARDVDGVRALVGAPALAAPIRARRVDRLTPAAAAVARRRGDHLAEDRLAHAAQLAGAAALRAGRGRRAGRSADAVAGLAADGCAQRHLLLGAEYCVLEVELGDQL